MPTTKITKTNTGSFDQVFALSQGYLNQSLKTLWQNTPRAVGLHALQMKNIMGSIDAEIGPPEIVVDISPSDKYVLFNINTLSGKIKLRDSDSGYVSQEHAICKTNCSLVNTSWVCHQLGST